MLRATILDFEFGTGEVRPTFWVVNPTSGGIPVEILEYKWWDY